MVIIRDVKETELDDLYNAFLSSATENGIGDRFLRDKEVLRNALFKEKYSFALVAVIENKPVAFLLYSKTQRNFTLHPHPGLYMHGLYVNIPYRRRKIGTRLVEALVQIAKQKRLGRVEFSLLRNNRVGELFLESLSFKEIDFIKPMRLEVST